MAQTLWAAQVWLTAFMTLLAGLPHYTCCCPNGQVKPFCLSLASRATGCCCDGTCCPTPRREVDRDCPNSPPSEPAKQCCCHAAAGHDPNAPGDGGRLHSQGCKKTLAETDAALASKQQTVKACWTGQALAPSAHLPDLPLPAAGESLSWQSHPLPPPTDLVVTLRHFVI